MGKIGRDMKDILNKPEYINGTLQFAYEGEHQIFRLSFYDSFFVEYICSDPHNKYETWCSFPPSKLYLRKDGVVTCNGCQIKPNVNYYRLEKLGDL